MRANVRLNVGYMKWRKTHHVLLGSDAVITHHTHRRFIIKRSETSEATTKITKNRYAIAKRNAPLSRTVFFLWSLRDMFISILFTFASTTVKIYLEFRENEFFDNMKGIVAIVSEENFHISSPNQIGCCDLWFLLKKINKFMQFFIDIDSKRTHYKCTNSACVYVPLSRAIGCVSLLHKNGFCFVFTATWLLSRKKVFCTQVYSFW